MDDAGSDAVKRAMSLQRQLQLKKKCDLPTKIKSQSNDFKLNGMQMNIYVLDGFSLHLHCFTRLIISGFFWNTQSEFFSTRLLHRGKSDPVGLVERKQMKLLIIIQHSEMPTKLHYTKVSKYMHEHQHKHTRKLIRCMYICLAIDLLIILNC